MANTPTVAASMTGFSVPVSGGAIIATGNATTFGGFDAGFLWIEIDGTGICDGGLPPTLAWWEALDDPVDSVSTSRTAAANAGSHRIDLCALAGNGVTGFPFGSLTVQWVEKSQGGTTAGFLSAAEEADLREQLQAALAE